VGYLALQILGNAIFTSLVKVGRTRKLDYLLFGGVNYLVAALVAAAAVLVFGTQASWEAILFGAVNGACYQVTFLLMYALLSMTGVAIMSSFLRLAVFMPTIASIAIWHEWPTPVQAAGLLLTAVALPLLGASAQRTAPAEWRSWRPLLLITATLLSTGLGLLASKAFAELHLEAQRPVYLFATFGIATVFSACAFPLRARLRIPAGPTAAAPAVVLGILAGLCNIGQLATFLKGLATLPGIIAFPVSAAGGLLAVTIAGRLIWKERFAGAAVAGIVLALVSVALVNA